HRTLLRYGLRPRGPFTCRVSRTAIKRALRLRALLDQVRGTLRAGDPDLDEDGLRVATLWEAGAGQEASKPSQLNHHVAAALLADLVGRLVGWPHLSDCLLG